MVTETFFEPGIYRAVIDEVISAIKPEFDEYGVSEEVLAELQHKWESKVIASHVAEFEPQPPPPPQHHHMYAPHPMMVPHHPHYPPPHAYPPPPPPVAQPQGPQVKTEPVDTRYVLGAPGMPYALPPLPGPQLNGHKTPGFPGGQQGVLSFPPHPGHIQRPPNMSRPYAPPVPQPPSKAPQPPSAPAATTAPQARAPGQKIPQVDGPSSSESDSPSPPPSQSFAPRASHPSLPQPSQSSSTTHAEDAEAINSDLDDSDTEAEEDAEEGGQGETDIVFCTYDKVGRVKNKWKCLLKDGMIHINGKDYLFAKCTGEFEW